MLHYQKVEIFMNIAISFLCTNFIKLKKHWNDNSTDKRHTGTNIGMGNIPANKKGIEPFLGGKFIVLSWEKQEIIWDMNIDAAAGFSIYENTLSINNMRLHYISIIDMLNKKEIKRIANPSFNCLHSLEKTPNGYLVSSTGADLIIEVDHLGDTIFEWWAIENGFDKLPDGNIRSFSKRINHNEYVYPTLSQACHINSAVTYNGKYILSTLFHQGQLIKINRFTGAYEMLLSGLNCPHGVKPYGTGWIVSNTKQNELIILDKDFKPSKIIQGRYNWVQDNCPLLNGNILIADANNNRIVEINPKDMSVVKEYYFSENWRIYQISLH